MIGMTQRLANARTLANRPNRTNVAKNPRSDKYIEPVKNGVSRADKDRSITMSSYGAGNNAPSASNIHSMKNSPLETTAAMI